MFGLRASQQDVHAALQQALVWLVNNLSTSDLQWIPARIEERKAEELEDVLHWIDTKMTIAEGHELMAILSERAHVLSVPLEEESFS
jgi:hypothetical protein